MPYLGFHKKEEIQIVLGILMQSHTYNEHTQSVDLYYNLTSIASISIQYFYVVNNSSGGNLSRIFIPRDPDVRLNALTAGKKAATNRLHREMKIFVLPTQEKLYPPTKKCEEKCPKPHTHNGSIDIS